jgi:hypothetical protein
VLPTIITGAHHCFIKGSNNAWYLVSTACTIAGAVGSSGKGRCKGLSLQTTRNTRHGTSEGISISDIMQAILWALAFALQQGVTRQYCFVCNHA